MHGGASLEQPCERLIARWVWSGATAFEMTCGWSVYNQNVNMKIGKRIDIHKAGGDENQRQRGQVCGQISGNCQLQAAVFIPSVIHHKY